MKQVIVITGASLALILALTSISAFPQATQQPRPNPFMTRDQEIATALSSVPPEVRTLAGVYGRAWFCEGTREPERLQLHH